MALKEFIDLVKKRPGMYVFSEGITEFSGLVRGYQCARRELVEIDEVEDELLTSYSNWLKNEKYPAFSGHELSWSRLLLLQHPNESRALSHFFESWDEYCNKDR